MMTITSVARRKLMGNCRTYRKILFRQLNFDYLLCYFVIEIIYTTHCGRIKKKKIVPAMMRASPSRF